MKSLTDLVRRHQSTGVKLSSNMDFLVLDEMLVAGLLPMEAESKSYAEWLGEVIAFTVTSRRRANDALVAACVVGLLGAPSAARVSAAGIDRGHVFSYLSHVQRLGATLLAAEVEIARHHGRRVPHEHVEGRIDSQRQLGRGASVGPAAVAASYWLARAADHKASIISHYVQLLLKVASRLSHASGNRVEADQAFGDAYVAASIAVNRFRADRGVFASYLAMCLKGSSRESASHALGLAAPGARVLSEDALQAGDIEAAMEVHDPSQGSGDDALLHQMDVIACDPDVRAFLMLSDVAPPATRRLAGVQ